MTIPRKSKRKDLHSSYKVHDPGPEFLTAIPVRNVWHMLLYAWDCLFLYGEMQAEVESSPTLDALLALILCQLLEKRLRRGLGRSYRERSDRIRGLRGKISFTESSKRQLFERGQAQCTFYELTPNISRNQIVKAVLRRLISSGDFGADSATSAELRHRLRANVRELAKVRDIEPSVAAITLETFNHGDRDYRVMLNIAALLLRRLMPSEASGSGSLLALQRESLILFRTFEAFVAKFYQHRLENWDVIAQSRQSWHLKTPIPNMPFMIPDLRLTHRTSGSMIVLDTKYYRDTQAYPAHLYQMYAYLRTQEHLSAHHDEAVGILLFPLVNSGVSEKLELPTKTIRIETIDLSKPWVEIEDALLWMISGSSARREITN